MLTPRKVLRGIRNPKLARHYLLTRLNRPVFSALNTDNNGVTILDEDWDNLIILDACRYDVFEEVNRIDGRLSKRKSRGEATPRFIRQNYAGRDMRDTVMVSANSVVGQHADQIRVHNLIGLWGTSAPSDINREDDNTNPGSLVDPEPVVQTALDLVERYPNKRLIIHFLQPHTPFVVKDGKPLPPDSKYRTFTAVRNGEVTNEEMRSVYRENVAYVLSHVERLVDNLKGKTVVTSDHGELLGEDIHPLYKILHPRWPIHKAHYFCYAHYNRIRVPELVEIPWLEIEDGTRRTIESATTMECPDAETNAIAEQLEALGYR